MRRLVLRLLRPVRRPVQAGAEQGEGAKKTKIAVVGAGMAGLSAARVLLDNWPKDAGKVEVVVGTGSAAVSTP